VFVKTNTGKIFTIPVESLEDTNVQMIKSGVEAAQGYPADQISLIFDGKELLEDSETLSSAKIELESTIIMVLKKKANTP
jgi:hypothetical protein